MQTITGRVTAQGTGDTPEQIAFEVKYEVTGGITGADSMITQVDKMATDQEMESQIREQVAAHINNLTGESFTESDVRGCKI